MKKQLNLGKAGMLLEKLIKDTKDNKLRWQKEVRVVTNLEDKKHAGELKGYKYEAQINDTLSAHLSNFDNITRVWLERNGERVYIDEALYEYPSILSEIKKLNDLVGFLSDVQIMKEIDEYLGVPFDEKAYLIDENVQAE